MTVASPRPRPARQGLTDFTLPVQREDVDEIGHATATPTGWPPIASPAFEAFEALPAETNELYTTYIDLRGAQLAIGTARPRRRGPSRVPVALPDGADGLLVLDEGDVTGSVLSAEAQAAGVEFTTRRRDARAASRPDPRADRRRRVAARRTTSSPS